MSLILYGFIGSPPVRSAMLVCEALKVSYTLEDVNPLKGDHLKPEYLKLSPIHSIPALKDGNFTLFDSHAIACYVADKYGQADNTWYPKDLQQRAIVNQRLHFNNGMLILRFKDLLLPVFSGRRRQLDQLAIRRVDEGLEQLDKLLTDNFIAGSEPTIADCCSSSVVLSMEVFLPKSIPSKVLAWLRRCESTLPAFQKVNQPAVAFMAKLKSSML